MKPLLLFAAFYLALTITYPPCSLSAANPNTEKTIEQGDSQSSDTGSKPEAEETSPTASKTSPPSTLSSEAQSLREKVSKELMQKTFTYDSKQLVDPFVSFIKPPEQAPPEVPVLKEEEALPPELQRPLTPLQKMNIGEIAKGLRAIVWGGLGRKAIIQDAAGKGYIVSVGTPAAGPTGVIVQIFDDRLIIQQEVWDRKLKRMVPKNEVVKLRKGKELEG